MCYSSAEGNTVTHIDFPFNLEEDAQASLTLGESTAWSQNSIVAPTRGYKSVRALACLCDSLLVAVMDCCKYRVSNVSQMHANLQFKLILFAMLTHWVQECALAAWEGLKYVKYHELEKSQATQ